jgi:hypothetical protein
MANATLHKRCEFIDGLRHTRRSPSFFASLLMVARASVLFKRNEVQHTWKKGEGVVSEVF